MILIADSGATKTCWCLCTPDGEQYFYTQGINPYHQSAEAISSIIRTELVPNFKLKTSGFKLFYYGAGCSSAQQKGIVERVLRENFPAARLEIDHDLLGAARALCGKEEGIAAILGTGSNSCCYDGKGITESVASLGYILGDEGSGAHIGKKFLSAFLYHELPGPIEQVFRSEYKLDKDVVLDAVYKQPLPGRFLASFTKFISKNISDPFLAGLVKNSFLDFFDHHICKYPSYKKVKTHFVGSVAFHFAGLLRQVAKEKGVTVGSILESPMEGLVRYHTA